MKIVSIGGGPAGLYFGILMKKADPTNEVVVLERNRPNDTFGFGVVFSDATLGNLAAADPETYAAITRNFAHWDDIDIHVRGEVFRSTGHGFCGLERKALLTILTQRCRELGVELRFEHQVADPRAVAADADLLLGADGVASLVRETWADRFGPEVEHRPNKFVWLGTTFPFEAFTFYFKENVHGLWRVHAYRYQEDGSTFIVECTEETWRRSGMAEADEDQTIAYLQEVFADELCGHPLVKNRSIWRSFPTIRNRRWHADNVVLVGDAVHTAHFSIGSGTKLAMEDVIALAEALAEGGPVPEALARYEARRRPEVEALQRAAQVSLEWFENTELYLPFEPVQFAFSLLTRSLRVSHDKLALRDPELVARVDRWFAEDAGALEPEGRVPPPMFVPLTVRDLVIPNRVVADSWPLGQAQGGVVGDGALVHLGARALGGVGLVMTEPVAVAPEGLCAEDAAGLWDADQSTAWQRIVEFIHAQSNATIGIRLTHAGRRAAGKVLLAPSPVPYDVDGAGEPRVVDRRQMARLIDHFVTAARMADDAGFDLLEIDLAGGNLLATFLSPLTNHREDEFGGTPERRRRFPLEVVEAVRRAWPSERPLSVRLCADDLVEGGACVDDAVQLARELSGRGCDLVAITSGETLARAGAPRARLAHAAASDRIRNDAGILTICGGGIASAGDINSLLAAGRADLCSLGRALAFDPNFVHRTARKLGWPLEWPPAYEAVVDFEPRE